MLYFGAFGFDVGTGRLTREGADVALGRTAAVAQLRELAAQLETLPLDTAAEEPSCCWR